MKVSRLLCVGFLLASFPARAEDPSSTDFSAAITAATGPTLADTVSWMDYTYNPHESSGSFGHGIKEAFDPSSNVNLFSRVMETFTYKDCLMVLSIQDDPNSTMNGVHSKSVQSFDLRNIDPKSIRVHTFDSHQNGEECSDPEVVQAFHLNCDSAEIQFFTKNQASLIDVESHIVDNALKGSDKDAITKTKETSGTFMVNNTDYAKRFARAFGHAVELCSKKQ